MSTSFQTIVCPLDGSEAAERALAPAVALARAVDGKLVLVRSVQLYGVDIGWYTHVGSEATPYEAAPVIPLKEMIAASRQVAEHYLHEVATRLAGRGVANVATVLSDAHPAEAILEAAGAKAAIIVMATHGAGGIERWVLGSVAEKIVQSAPVPVLLIRAGEDETGRPPLDEGWHPKHILVTLDGSKEAESVLAPAADLAKALGATVTAAHAVVEPRGVPWTATLEGVKGTYTEKMLAYLVGIADRLKAQGIPTTTQLEAGPDAAEVILGLERSQGVDLVALATHGYGGWRRLALGSVADRVVRNSGRPVLLVRAQNEG